MKYKIVSNRSSSLITCQSYVQDKVNELCANGWKPQGGISIATDVHGYTTYYTVCQAMIKYEEIKGEESIVRIFNHN